MEINERSKKYYTILDKLLKSAIFFNRIVDGKKIEEMSENEIRAKIKTQIPIVAEELVETLQALEDEDEREYYDGLVDVLYTKPFLTELRLQLTKFSHTKTIENIGVVEYIDDTFGKLIEFGFIKMDILSKYADRVIANNMEKFTTNEAVFKTWKSEYTPTSKVIDGVTYYFFVDENGKVKKRDGFPKIEVGGLFNGIK